MSEKQEQPETCIMINVATQRSVAVHLDSVGRLTSLLLQIHC